MKTFLCLAAFLVACGGDDGVSGSKKLSDLSASESMSLCNDFAHDFPSRTVSCTDGDITVGFSAADCSNAGTIDCEGTVDQFHDCYDAIYGMSDSNICMLDTLPTECEPVSSCVQ